MSKFDIRSKFECQNKILNVRIRYLARIRMSKYDYECQNAIFGPNSNVEKRKTKSEKRKAKNEKQTSFTLN